MDADAQVAVEKYRQRSRAAEAAIQAMSPKIQTHLDVDARRPFISKVETRNPFISSNENKPGDPLNLEVKALLIVVSESGLGMSHWVATSLRFPVRFRRLGRLPEKGSEFFWVVAWFGWVFLTAFWVVECSLVFRSSPKSVRLLADLGIGWLRLFTPFLAVLHGNRKENRRAMLGGPLTKTQDTPLWMGPCWSDLQNEARAFLLVFPCKPPNPSGFPLQTTKHRGLANLDKPS